MKTFKDKVDESFRIPNTMLRIIGSAPNKNGEFNRRDNGCISPGNFVVRVCSWALASLLPSLNRWKSLHLKQRTSEEYRLLLARPAEVVLVVVRQASNLQCQLCAGQHLFVRSQHLWLQECVENI
ncbi:hypothetical protein CBL_20319 [Carabus blaptoides fortunei]